MKADMFVVSEQVLVPGTTTTALLQQLIPDTDYNVGVVALYSDGEGATVSDQGKTCKYERWKDKQTQELLVYLLPVSFTKEAFFLSYTVPRGGPRNMRVYDPTTSTLSVSWEHADGPVVQYRITYAPTTGDPIEEYVSTIVTQFDSYFEGVNQILLFLYLFSNSEVQEIYEKV